MTLRAYWQQLWDAWMPSTILSVSTSTPNIRHSLPNPKIKEHLVSDSVLYLKTCTYIPTVTYRVNFADRKVFATTMTKIITEMDYRTLFPTRAETITQLLSALIPTHNISNLNMIILREVDTRSLVIINERTHNNPNRYSMVFDLNHVHRLRHHLFN